MLLPLIAFVAGLLTIASPCILPVLPIALAHEKERSKGGRLPFLAGLALTFACVASLAAVAGHWAVDVSQFGRWLGLAMLAVFALALIWPRIADAIARPFTRVGASLLGQSPSGQGGLVVGMATGLVWTPCAGPILGLLLSSAAITGPGAGTALSLLAFGAGAALGIGAIMIVGRRAALVLRRLGFALDRLRPVLGVAVLALVGALATGVDTRLLSIAQPAGLTRIESKLTSSAAAFGFTGIAWAAGTPSSAPSPLDSLSKSGLWLQGPSLDRQSLRGKVVLVDFWTYSCINCLRTLPYVRSWADKYGPQGLVVIGVHTPEFAFEKDQANVQAAIRTLGLRYPVIADNDFGIWQRFQNEAWPGFYLVDAQGQVRKQALGEGDYDGIERELRALLTEAHRPNTPGPAQFASPGTQAETDFSLIGSPETYVGYAKAERFAGDAPQQPDRSTGYTAPASLPLNGWAFAGTWAVRSEFAETTQPDSAIIYRYRSRDMHLVLAPGRDGRPVRFRVTIDGQAPGADHGTDTDAQGSGTIDQAKLYQLVRQRSPSATRTVTVTFDRPGVRAYAFTFG